MFKVECQLQFPTGMTRVHCHSSCCRQTVQTCKWRCHLPVHGPHGQGIMEKFHSSRDEEVEILVPWEGRDVECQTKVACSNRQPAKGTEVTIEDRCETDVTPCHAYMIQSHSQPGKTTEITIEDTCENDVTPCHAWMIQSYSQPGKTTDDTSTSHFQASKYYPWFDVINKNYSSLFLVCCRLSQIKVSKPEVKSWGQNLRSSHEVKTWMLKPQVKTWGQNLRSEPEVKTWGQVMRSKPEVADSHQSLGVLGSWLYVTWCVG